MLYRSSQTADSSTFKLSMPVASPTPHSNKCHHYHNVKRSWLMSMATLTSSTHGNNRRLHRTAPQQLITIPAPCR